MMKITAILLIIISAIIGLSFVNEHDLIGDEPYHATQVDRFVNNDYTLLKGLTVPPTYHHTIAFIAKSFSVNTLAGYRIINTVLLLVTLIPLFYLLSKSLTKTFQLYFFPLMFMFYFLVYTDLFSLMIVFAAFYFAKKKWYWLSAVFGTISIFVRQNNIFWIGFVCCYIYVNEYRYKISWQIIKDFYNKIWLYCVGVVLFGIFIWMKGSIVMGDAERHPIAIHFGNVWLILFLFFFLFFPYIIVSIPRMIEYVKNKKSILLLLVAVFLIGLGTFHNDHIYNNKPGIWFNNLLQMIQASSFLLIVYFLIITVVILYLCVVKFEDKGGYLLYPFTILFLLFSWLIEPRYYFIPFALFILFKPSSESWVEKFVLWYYVIVGVLFFMMMLP